MGDTSIVASWLKLIVAFPIVIFLAYISLKLATRMQTGMQKGLNLEVVERLGLSKNVQLMIIRVGDDYQLMSVNEGNVVSIQTLDFEPLIAENKHEDLDFKEVLKEQWEKIRWRKE